MEIKAQVRNVLELNDYFFIVPDYQREYVWKADDEVEQFLIDINNEFDQGAKSQNNYFIGSIIIVKNKDKYDVIDGQQRLTTVVLTMCALRDVFKELPLNQNQKLLNKEITDWLYRYHVASGRVQLRLELQYDESRDYLKSLIQEQVMVGEITASIRKMSAAYERVTQEFESYLQVSLETLVDFATYFMTKIDLVVIESENLSSALKIFETINQRGASLNAMDLIKNLLFSKATANEFGRIKERWKELTQHLHEAREDDKPLRFLRYFLMARYHDGILREDEIYKWVISDSGKAALNYESKPYALVVELVRVAERYAALVKATERQKAGGDYPHVTRIGFINKYRSRQHLILLLALHESAEVRAIDYLAKQLESYFFFNNTLGIQAKDNERLFVQWVKKLRGLRDEANISDAITETILSHLSLKVGEFKERFLSIRHSAYDPGYRLRFVLGSMENTLLKKAGMPQISIDQINGMQIEHILPQTPKNDLIPDSYAKDIGEYRSQVYRLGNVMLLESVINQAVNNFNDLGGNWFYKKQQEYVASVLLSAKFLNHEFTIGQNTAVNRLKASYEFEFQQWNKAAIEKRQSILLELALDTWTINDQRIDI